VIQRSQRVKKRSASHTAHMPRKPARVRVRASLESREYQRRRARLAEVIGEDGIAIVPSAPISIRNRDIEYAYRPDSDFLYLTGFAEPEAVAVLVPGREHGDFLMFCRERDEDSERWVGPRPGLDEACDQFGADDAFPISDLDDILPGLLEERRHVYYSMGSNSDFDHRMLGWLNQMRHFGGGVSPPELVALGHFLHDMRLFKSAGEVRLMRSALEVTSAAHARAMRTCEPGRKEFELEAELLYEMHRRGCRTPAYPCIVAGGVNACALHYTANRSVLRDGDLVLIDAGAEYEYYAADVTRTFPVSGRFSEPQRDLYEVVLEAQHAAIAAVSPGGRFAEVHEVATHALTRGLVELGILKGNVTDLLAAAAYERFFTYPTSHWLGLDVHDVGDYQVGGEARVLEPGMTLTIEPGVYISADDDSVSAHWRGQGIRIEDDVLVTRDGNEVLSAAIPKTVAELEAVIGTEPAPK
jgi:Xaa-Pro aminopeptidase